MDTKIQINSKTISENSLRKGIGLGLFSFSNVFSLVSEFEAHRIINYYLDGGGKYIETAPIYKNNSFVRKVLSVIPRDSYVLSSKCAKDIDDQGNVTSSGKYKYIIDGCDRELKSLEVDHIDIYILHKIPSDAEPGETMHALKTLQKQGKIIDIGISNTTLDQLKSYNESEDIRFIQNRLSLLSPTTDPNLEDYLSIKNIINIPYRVVERGLLTNKLLSGFTLRKNNLRLNKPEFSISSIKKTRNWLVNWIKPISDSLEIPIETLAIAWVLHQSCVGWCTLGVSNEEQLKINIQALNIRLSDEILDQINYARSKYDNIRKTPLANVKCTTSDNKTLIFSS